MIDHLQDDVLQKEEALEKGISQNARLNKAVNQKLLEREENEKDDMDVDEIKKTSDYKIFKQLRNDQADMIFFQKTPEAESIRTNLI